MCARAKRTIVLVSCLLTLNGVLAQSRPDAFSNLSVSLQRHFGSFIANAPKATYVRDAYSGFSEITVSQQTDGRQPWHRPNRYPRTGVGIAFGSVGSNQYVGKALSVYPFITFPLIRSKGTTSLFRLGTGVTAVEKPYDIETNHKNTLIGSRFNNYIHVSLDNEFRLSQPLRLGAGLTFAHISNGNIKLPNYGLNFLLVSAGLRYVFSEGVVRDSTRPHFAKEKKVRALLSAGAKQTPWISSPRYVVGVASADLVQSLSPANAVGGGVDLFLDPSLTRDPSGFSKDDRVHKNLQVGVHAFYERGVGRITIPVQAGVYVANATRTKRFYQTIGLRYQLSPQVLLFYHLKTHGGKADFLHFGLGYTL